MERPWVTPQEIRDYSDYASVQTRLDVKLQTDIARAEQYIISYTHNLFLEELPESVRLAVLLLAEAYAYNAYVSAKEIKSETFDDYSYTTDTKGVDLDTLGISDLLENYKMPVNPMKTELIMRSL